MPRCHLLKKLKFYRMESNFISWIEKRLTIHDQQRGGKSSKYVSVSSGVRQGTALGLLMFF